MSLLVGWVSGFCVVFGFRFCVADCVACLRILLYGGVGIIQFRGFGLGCWVVFGVG